jgi:hypothetical protein
MVRISIEDFLKLGGNCNFARDRTSRNDEVVVEPDSVTPQVCRLPTKSEEHLIGDK